jgi:hypothetical protein
MLGISAGVARALLYVTIALVGAHFFLRFVRLPLTGLNRLSLAWVVLTVAAFCSGHFLVFSTVALIVVVSLKKQQIAATSIYIALLPLVPLHVYAIPGALGINYLFNLDYQRVLMVLVLVPTLISLRTRTEPKGKLIRNSVDFLFWSYCLWLLVLSFAHRTSTTDILRAIFELIAFLLVPYLAISRLVRTRDDMRQAILALALSGVMVSFIGIMEQRMTWHFYEYIPSLLRMEEPEVFARAQDIRFGLLRIRSSVGGGLGYFLVFSLCALVCLWRLKSPAGWRSLAACIPVATALLFTGSRGPWIAAGIMLIGTWTFPLFKSPIRFLLAGIAALVAMPYVQAYFLNASDQFGTYNYRADLFKSSTPLIWVHPIKGWNNMYELFATGRLDHLRQGQGIIDLVNTYLGEALFRGIPGIILFVGVLLSAIWSVLRRHQEIGPDRRSFDTCVAAMLCSMVLATGFMLMTTSMVGHIPSYLWLLIALCSAYASLVPEVSVDVVGNPATARNVIGARRLSQNRSSGARIPA